MKDKVRLNWCIKTAGIIFLAYGILECSDVFTNLFAYLGWAKADYPAFYFSGVNKMFTENHLYTFLFTLIPTSMRIISGIGILRNRLWGFWFGVIVSVYTLAVFTLFLPMGVYDGILTVLVLSFLLIGYFGKKPIQE